ncbi:MAG TPA: TonB-dependent receptor [Salinivirgaceae bacterium]|nr:TonB-dependent receptor [Salinivirgaceae bacterium]
MGSRIVDIFELSLEDLLNVEIVTASKFQESINETPSNVLVITRKEIENRGYTSLYEIMYDIPGFDIAAAFSDLTQLHYARGNRTGSFNERTMFMIDGVEANILYAQIMNISSDFPLSAIKQIEIIYGPASAIYGPNVFSGIINVITENGSNLPEKSSNIYTRSGVGSNNTQFAEATYTANFSPIEFSLSYRRFKSNMFDISNAPGYFANGQIIGNPDIWGPYAQYYPEYQNSSNDHSIISKVKFKEIELGYSRLFTNHGLGSQYPYDKTLPTTDWIFQRDILYLKINKDLSEKLKLTFLGVNQKCGSPSQSQFALGDNQADHWDSTRTVEFLNWKYMSERWAIFQDFEYRPVTFLTINGGVKYSLGTYQKSYELGLSDQTTWLPGQSWTTPLRLFPVAPSDGFSAGNTFIETDYGAFLQSKVLLMENKMSIVGGVRYDKNNNYGEIVSPRLGATYSISTNTALKASYGTGFQTPAPRNRYGSWGGLDVNPNLKPDKIQALEMGISSKLFKNFGVDAFLFYNKITNSIMQGENLPEKNIYGFESRLNYILPNLTGWIKNAYLHFNYSYLKPQYAQERFNANTQRKSKTIGDIAPHKFNMILNFEAFKYARINFRVNFVGEKETEISNPIEKIDPYLVSHLSLQVINIFENKCTVVFNINNIFNAEYYHPGMDKASAGEDLSSPSNGWYSSRLPQPGRHFMLGINFNL